MQFLLSERHRIFGCLLAVCVVGCVGCSGRPKNVARKVSGKVTLGGQPLPNASVTFTPTEGSPSFGLTDAEGKYNLVWGQQRGKRIEGAQIGEHSVTISTFQFGDPSAKQAKAEVPEKVPFKYREGPDRLKATVKSGANEINFDLESGPVEAPQTKGKGKTKGKK
jgi:hypothetical protein